MAGQAWAQSQHGLCLLVTASWATEHCRAPSQAPAVQGEESRPGHRQKHGVGMAIHWGCRQGSRVGGVEGRQEWPTAGLRTHRGSRLECHSTHSACLLAPHRAVGASAASRGPSRPWPVAPLPGEQACAGTVCCCHLQRLPGSFMVNAHSIVASSKWMQPSDRTDAEEEQGSPLPQACVWTQTLSGPIL